MEPRNVTLSDSLAHFTLYPSDNTAFLSQIIETQNDIAAVELDTPLVMRMIVERTQKLTAAQGAVLGLIEGDHIVFHAASGSARAHVGLKVPLSSSMSGLCATGGELLYCADTDKDPRATHEIYRRLGIRSMILVPLTHLGKVAGVLKVLSAKPNAFNDQSILGLQLMGGLLGAALTHAAEFEIKKNLLAERTHTLNALRESQDRFHSAFEHAAIGMALVAPDGRWLQVNHSICRIVGYTEKELLTTDFQSLTYPPDLDADLAFVRQLLAGEIADYQMIKRYIHQQGHLVWALLSVSLVRDAAGKPLYFISQIQDITQRQRAEDALRTSEEEYRATFELAGVGKAQADLQSGRFLRVNKKLCEMTGYSPKELLALTFGQITHPDDRAATDEAMEKMLRGEIAQWSAEKRYLHKNGSVVWISLNTAMIKDVTGNRTRGVATIEDITARKHALWLEQDRRKILEMVVKDLPLDDILAELTRALQRQIPDARAAVMLLRDGDVSLLAPLLTEEMQDALRQIALPLAVQLSANLWDSPDHCGVTYMHADPLWQDLRLPPAQHRFAACWALPIQSTDDTPIGLLSVFTYQPRPPTPAELQTLDKVANLATICIEHHNTTRQLAHLVRHDSLTGLPNRVMCEDRVQQAIALARRNKKSAAFFALDIDKFKSINDTLGHDAGDHLLQQLAQRLRAALRKSDTIARLGGDEFAVILPAIADPQEARTVAQKLIDALVAPFDVGRASAVRTTVSIGIALFPADGEDSPSLHKKADAALYRAKANGRNTFSL